LAESMMSNYRRSVELLLPDAEARRRKTPVTILEKFPEHIFRLELLRKLTGGQARFVYLKRSAVAVARSVARFAQAAWYGARDQKWKQLKEQLQKHFTPSGQLLMVLEATTGAPERLLFARGLVEWALSVQALRNAAGPDILEICYEELTINPSAVLERLQVLFVHNDEGPKVAHWAKEILRPCTTDVPLTAMEDEVVKLMRGSGIDQLLEEERNQK